MEKSCATRELPSRHGFDETVERAQNLARLRGLTIFAMIDHSGEADKAGLSMPPTKLLILGNPGAGTPLMLAAPTVAIDLPLKILVSQDDQGRTWVTYDSPSYLKQRHGLPEELMENISGIDGLAKAITE